MFRSCGGRSCPAVEDTREGGKTHCRYEPLGEEQNEGDDMMELSPLEGGYTEWLRGKVGRSCSEEMETHEGECNERTATHYAYEQVRNKNEQNELRKEQTKVTLFSVNRCFKLVNDGVFLLKMACNLGGETEWKNLPRGPAHTVAFIWLLCLYITSLCTFHLRKFFIVHMIPEEHHALFSLFGVFKKVAHFRGEEIPILCFYSRMERTYMIVNKFLEDIPQFFLYLLCVWMNGGGDVLFFLFCLGCWVLYIVISVFYRGLGCPMLGAMARLFVSASLVE